MTSTLFKKAQRFFSSPF
jgi:fatty-acyl-CoA synthase